MLLKVFNLFEGSFTASLEIVVGGCIALPPLLTDVFDPLPTHSNTNINNTLSIL